MHHVRIMNTIARYTLVAGILALAGVLSWKGKLDTTITSLLSLAVGYILGRQKADEG